MGLVLVKFYSYLSALMFSIVIYNVLSNETLSLEARFKVLAILVGIVVLVAGVGIIAGLLTLKVTDAAETELMRLDGKYGLRRKGSKLMGWLLIGVALLLFLWISSIGSVDTEQMHNWKPSRR